MTPKYKVGQEVQTKHWEYRRVFFVDCTVKDVQYDLAIGGYMYHLIDCPNTWTPVTDYWRTEFNVYPKGTFTERMIYDPCTCGAESVGHPGHSHWCDKVTHRYK